MVRGWSEMNGQGYLSPASTAESVVAHLGQKMHLASLVHVLIISRPTFCNVHYIHLVQNGAAKVFTKLGCKNHIFPVLF